MLAPPLQMMPRQQQNCAPILLEVEQLLTFGNALRPEWTAALREQWRSSASNPNGLTLREVVLHLAAMQVFVIEPPMTISRPIFMRYVQLQR